MFVLTAPCWVPGFNLRQFRFEGHLEVGTKTSLSLSHMLFFWFYTLFWFSMLLHWFIAILIVRVVLIFLPLATPFWDIWLRDSCMELLSRSEWARKPTSVGVHPATGLGKLRVPCKLAHEKLNSDSWQEWTAKAKRQMESPMMNATGNCCIKLVGKTLV